MKNLKIWQKLAVVATMFLVPCVLVSYHVMGAMNALGATEREVAYTLGWMVLTILAGSAIGAVVTREVTRSLQQAAQMADRIAAGNLGGQLTLTSRADEVGILARAFQRISDELARTLREVQTAGVHVEASVEEIAMDTQQQEIAASKIAVTTSEVGATSREISATARELVRTMSQVTAVTEQTAALAGAGRSELAHMQRIMREVTDAVDTVNLGLAALNEKASGIGQVVTTITQLADQTNLLSLNAAIEAQKAGKYGLGFAVIATQMRRLADQTAVATYDVDRTVADIQSAMAAGKESMGAFSEEVRRGGHRVQEVGDRLSQIIYQTQVLASRFGAVGEGMQAQAMGAEQISDALAQLIETSKCTVRSLQRSNEAIGGLNRISHAMSGAAERFKLA